MKAAAHTRNLIVNRSDAHSVRSHGHSGSASTYRFGRLIAAALAAVLAIGAPVALATPASAAAATLTVGTVPSGGGLITVTGSGFNASNTAGYLVALAPANAANYAAASTANTLVAGSTMLIQPGVTANPNATPPLAVLDNSGGFSVQVTVPAATAGGWRVYVTSAGTPEADTTVRSSILSYATAPTPNLTVSLPNNATSLEPTATTTITVSGTGFVAQGALTSTSAGYYAPALLAGDFSGVYVVFGKFRSGWQPSSSQSSTAANRTVIASKWAVAPANFGTGALSAQAGAIALASDGSFTTSFDVTISDAQDLLSGTYGVYSYAGGGVRYAPFETYTAVTVNPFPRVSVTPSTSNIAQGTTVTVTGTGFAPRSNGATNATTPPLSSSSAFGGVYVVFGKFRSGWQPSSSPSSTAANRTVIQSRWGVLQANLATVGGANAGAFVVDASGNWTTTFTLSTTTAAELVSGNYGIYTYGGGSSRFAPFESYTPVSFAAPTPSPSPSPTPTAPANPGGSSTVPSQSGSLQWAVDADFRSYILGSVAQGSITVSGGATASGAVTSFGQSSSSYNFTTQTGTVNYAGSVRFVGHSGALDLNFANPSISVDSASSGTLWLTVNDSRVAFATLNLAAAGRSESGGAQAYSNVPVTLSSAGAAAFAGYYSAGRTLAPLSFVVGSPGNALAGSTGVVAAAVKKPSFTPAATVPSKTGITLDSVAARAFTTGGVGTITVDGFQPNETGIAVVVYSTPTVLATELVADANGVVTWTGSLPAGLIGTHTLTVQGSVSKGVELTVVAATKQCVVTEAQLSWGFKQSFLAYLDSTIANGSWALNGPTQNGTVFDWTAGSGAVDSSSSGVVLFPGSVRFTGHSGALDTTIANPQIELASDGSGFLLLDITGTTQSGQTVKQSGVRFATLELTALQHSGDTLSVQNAPATLTSAGAGAFGTYPAGESLDPVSFTIPLAAGCSSAAIAQAGAAPTAEQGTTSAVNWVWIALAAGLLVLAALVVVLVLRRRAA